MGFGGGRGFDSVRDDDVAPLIVCVHAIRDSSREKMRDIIAYAHAAKLCEWRHWKIVRSDSWRFRQIPNSNCQVNIFIFKVQKEHQNNGYYTTASAKYIEQLHVADNLYNKILPPHVCIAWRVWLGLGACTLAPEDMIGDWYINVVRDFSLR